MTPRDDLAPLIDAAQRVAGVVAARGRGDVEGARSLLTSFSGEQELSAGALVVAEVTLQLLSRATGESIDECVRALTLDLEAVLAD